MTNISFSKNVINWDKIQNPSFIIGVSACINQKVYSRIFQLHTYLKKNYKTGPYIYRARRLKQ